MLAEIVSGKHLSFEGAYQLFNEFKEMEPVKISAYLVAMQTNGYTEEEIAGFAQAMRDAAPRMDLGDTCDTCGTGGDWASTINVSTAASIILSCFNPVAKHGNRSVTSNSGSTNVLEELGINTVVESPLLFKGIKECKFAYLHAPLYHKSLANIMPVRKALGIRTIFNMLGPLTNPARPKYQMMGVSDESIMEIVSKALQILDVEKAVIIHGAGLDEVHPSKCTKVHEIGRGKIEQYMVSPEDFGFNKTKIIPCKNSAESAIRIKAVLSGEGMPEDKNLILINASMALYTTGEYDLTECREMVESVLGTKTMEQLELIRNAYPKL